MMTHVRFDPPHLLREYAGKRGHEIGGLALSPPALDALADDTVTGSNSLVVIGRWDRDDGAFFLDFGVPTGHIEATTDYRWDRDAKRLRLICPVCDLKDGKHMKSCDR